MNLRRITPGACARFQNSGRLPVHLRQKKYIPSLSSRIGSFINCTLVTLSFLASSSSLTQSINISSWRTSVHQRVTATVFDEIALVGKRLGRGDKRLFSFETSSRSTVYCFAFFSSASTFFRNSLFITDTSVTAPTRVFTRMCRVRRLAPILPLTSINIIKRRINRSDSRTARNSPHLCCWR